ncbi:MAG: hypothetical protein C3F06_02795 [Candidatus Methanoperedenaceae archaeon]|nr:MAG: hypothetical protein C3F06_02795 [Candidatus Methanoperedenaceae archaeon]
MNYDLKEIKVKVDVAIGVLFKNDSFLLENGVNERSVSHKLAEYLQQEIPDWNVDCEYNRKGSALKTLERIRECSEERKTDRVFPDIIIHQRNTKINLLVLEIKTKDEDPICDIQKLILFTSDRECKYNFGSFIKFNRAEKPDLKWFKDGEEI